nr:YraN family protein [Roseimicrobium sp. ORNL1]
MQSLATWRTGLRDYFTRPSLRTRMRLAKADGTRFDNATLGNWGEHLAAQWLRRHGRKVLYRNYRAGGGGEVDIVARHGKMLTFVEVKTRTSTERGRPAEAVNKAKEKLILRGMQGWLRMLQDAQNIPRRCDIVEVVLREGERPEISILEGALKA